MRGPILRIHVRIGDNLLNVVMATYASSLWGAQCKLSFNQMMPDFHSIFHNVVTTVIEHSKKQSKCIASESIVSIHNLIL